MSDASRMEGFLRLSSELTGFSVFDLRGTGEATAYLDAAASAVGEDILKALLVAHGSISEAEGARKAQIRRMVLDDPKLGPVARSIIKMWFSGVWYELPKAWASAYGAVKDNTTFSVRPSSYAEGLLWKNIGASPPGARAPGYGSWAEPPRIPDPDQGLSLLSAD